MKKSIIVSFAIIVVIIILFFYFFKSFSYNKTISKNELTENKQLAVEKNEQIEEKQEQENYKNIEENKNIITPSTNLALPFDVADMWEGNKFISPFGIIRHERDKGNGHAGIDIPLSKDDKLYAVADGEIISNEPATDGPGNNIVLLLAKTEEGEGLGFLYEHTTLNPGITINSKVMRGQFIGKTAINTNNHLGLVYYFNNFKYTRNPVCWVEQLANEDKQKLLTAWETIRTSSAFTESWRNAREDNAYAYRALLNQEKFPGGPQLCYTYGLDVREFA